MRDDDLKWSLLAVRRLVIDEVRALMHWHERQAAALRQWLARAEPPIDNGPPDPSHEPEIAAARRRRRQS